jgi:hypothetical protein
MKFVLALAVSAGALWGSTPTPAAAQADPYRWCAELGGGGEGSFSNCYFITRAQCEATVAGIGGFCRHNQFYTGPATASGGDELPPRRVDKKRTTR